MNVYFVMPLIGGGVACWVGHTDMLQLFVYIQGAIASNLAPLSMCRVHAVMIRLPMYPGEVCLPNIDPGKYCTIMNHTLHQPPGSTYKHRLTAHGKYPISAPIS